MVAQTSYSKIYSLSLLRSIGKLLLQPYAWQSQLSRVLLNFKFLKIANKPRYKPIVINLFGGKLELVDSVSFLWTYPEIFWQEIYKFKTTNFQPLIIDCGANIGLSVLYFKQLYPESRIIAFEPDSQIFNALEKNVSEFNLSGVELIKKAVWISETFLNFTSEGGDAGRFSQGHDLELNTYQVPTIRLRDYLNQPVDFLKIDIEGAETTVIEDCSQQLCNVDKIFVEYHSFAHEPQSLNVLLNILKDAGFRINIHTIGKSQQPLVKRDVHNGMDMQLNIFGWREP